MTKLMPMVEARQKLTTLPEDFERTPEGGAVAVTRRGKPVLAVLSWDFYESLVETLEIAGDEQLLLSLRKAIKEAEAGKTLPWTKVKKRLHL